MGEGQGAYFVQCIISQFLTILNTPNFQKSSLVDVQPSLARSLCSLKKRPHFKEDGGFIFKIFIIL